MKKENTQYIDELTEYRRWLDGNKLENDGIYSVHLNLREKNGTWKYKERIILKVEGEENEVYDERAHIKDTQPIAVGLTAFFINPDEYSLLNIIERRTEKVVDRHIIGDYFIKYFNHQWEIAQRLGRYGDLHIDFPRHAKIDESFIKEHIKKEKDFINQSETFFSENYKCVKQEDKVLLKKYVSDYFTWLIKQYDVKDYSVGFGISLSDEQCSKLRHSLIEKKYIEDNITDWEFKAIFGNGYVFKRIVWIKKQRRNKSEVNKKALLDLFELLEKKLDYDKDRHKVEACFVDSYRKPLQLKRNTFNDNKTIQDHSEFFSELKEIVEILS